MRFPREKLWTLYEKHQGLAFDVTWLAAREETILGDYLVTVGQRRATERVAFVLLHLFRRARQLGLARNNKVTFPFTQDHLADTIGFSLVHTNKTLKQLRRTGSFKWTGTDFELQNEQRLAELAGDASPISGVRPLSEGCALSRQRGLMQWTAPGARRAPHVHGNIRYDSNCVEGALEPVAHPVGGKIDLWANPEVFCHDLLEHGAAEAPLRPRGHGRPVALLPVKRELAGPVRTSPPPTE